MKIKYPPQDSMLLALSLELIKVNVRLCLVDTTETNIEYLKSCYDFIMDNDELIGWERSRVARYYGSQVSKIAEAHDNIAKGVRSRLNS